MTMKKYGGKSALIVGLTLLGLYSIWPPKEKLKTGIDLSGGTILQYEVTKTGAAAGSVNIDELITALKRRINPEGVLDIPIRRIGNTRIELILPKATAEDVEEVKRKMTNVGSLEFRILANNRHDSTIIPKALESKELTNPSSRYRWAKLGETYTGVNPTSNEQGNAITDAS
jgi:SecD/SecF fusion protein